MARIRLATLRDLDVLVRHRRKMFEEMWVLPPADLDVVDRAYRRWARTRLRSGKFLAFLVESRRGRIAASGGLWLMPLPPRPGATAGQAPYLMSMYTEREDRGKGYATLIVRAAVRWAKRRGFKVVILHASDAGRRIYEREGFRPTPEMRLRFDRPKLRRNAPRSRQRPTRRRH